MTLVLLALMLAVVASLALGLFSFFRGGAFNARYGNKLMQARVGLQALAILVLAILIFFGQTH